MKLSVRIKLYLLETFIIAGLICTMNVANAQILNNQGAKIKVNNGTTIKFYSLNNEQMGSYFYYDTDLIVPGNWTNVSPASFDQGTNGSLTLNGTTQQTITSGGSSFQNLTINNSAANDNEIILADNMSIESSLTLTDGIVNTNANKLVFQSTATTNSGNAGSFVHGQMEKAGATQFTFPCGDVNSRDLDGDAVNENYVVWSPMKSNPSASTIVNVEYFFDNIGMPDWWEHGGNMAPTLHHVSDREYYLVSATEDFTDITLYWNDNDHAVSDICVHSFCDGTPANFSPTDLSVVYWNGSMWVDVEYNSGSSNLVHDEGYITSRFNVLFGAKSQTYITYGSKNNLNPLPVELLNLEVACKGDESIIHWTTTSEINNYGFEIEKSVDAIKFEKVGFVKGNGNSNNLNEYSFVFQNEDNSAYFRLKQIDYNHNYVHSNVVFSNCNTKNTYQTVFSLYPNPSNGIINLAIDNIEGHKIQIQVYDLLGSIVFEHNDNIFNNQYFKEFNFNNLPPSLYIVKISSNNFSQITRFEIQ